MDYPQALRMLFGRGSEPDNYDKITMGIHLYKGCPTISPTPNELKAIATHYGAEVMRYAKEIRYDRYGNETDITLSYKWLQPLLEALASHPHPQPHSKPLGGAENLLDAICTGSYRVRLPYSSVGAHSLAAAIHTINRALGYTGANGLHCIEGNPYRNMQVTMRPFQFERILADWQQMKTHGQPQLTLARPEPSPTASSDAPTPLTTPPPAPGSTWVTSLEARRKAKAPSTTSPAPTTGGIVIRFPPTRGREP